MENEDVMNMVSEEEVLKVMKDAGKPLKTQEIADMLGVDKKEVDKIIKKLKKEGKITSPKRCYYAPS
ncbi:HTH domain-containing protein [Aciduliprofundum sp. MAR08-339]|uniref:FaeA/PapI family transcriptional regulator n=1 Tax=Aciduliprofundum sp. (strain MAR08-339) TaxID=673860 RepID=UPI0002A48631|nr:HTH domain-containing protein [Aciduliprofundum sp. MAR08-339]